ncbi:Methyl-CpG DNA binding [Parasponia andersonii]|uniref:Methyl-CpG DNA binding n=1 Tax=Parasponia andersonii TaxID=3476 RepID=A0A2P5AAE3_PARAD|nr:Methyl-CpG DNA binding [Parasponia andersonii]
MSVPGASGPYPNQTRQDPDRKAQPVGAVRSDFPPDPLLGSGSFIDATTNANGRSTPVDDRKAQTAEPRRSSNGGAACPGAEKPNAAEPGSGRGKRKPPEPELDWLPSGWTFEDRVRISGVTAGSTDRYYIDPVSGRKFRSKNEVLYFLETGIPRKKKKQGENSDAPSAGSSGGHNQKSSTTKKGSALNFDFSNVPEKVQWVLTESSKESWKAFIDNDQVPETSLRDWLAAFTFLASRDRGRYH